MIINKKKEKWLELIVAWKRHIDNNICCGECKDKRVKCPINLFFKEVEKECRKSDEVKNG